MIEIFKAWLKDNFVEVKGEFYDLETLENDFKAYTETTFEARAASKVISGLSDIRSTVLNGFSVGRVILTLNGLKITDLSLMSRVRKEFIKEQMSTFEHLIEDRVAKDKEAYKESLIDQVRVDKQECKCSKLDTGTASVKCGRCQVIELLIRDRKRLENRYKYLHIKEL